MFQFRRFPSLTYLIQLRIHGLFPCEFPHSEICGSKVICTSPQLIAAYRVLHRLLMPRHPSYALSSLTYLTITSSLVTSNYCGNLLRICKIVFEFFNSTLCFPEKPSNLICLKSFPICCFHFLNVFSLFSFQCAGRDCFLQSTL